VIILLLQIFSSFCWAEVTSQGAVRMQTDLFYSDSNSATRDFSLLLKPDLKIYSEDKWINFNLDFGAQIDQQNNDRASFFLKEAWIAKSISVFDVKAGFQVFNWSFNDFFDATNIWNSRNLDGDVEKQEKLGELTLLIENENFLGSFNLFYSPWFTSPHMPPSSSRLNPLGVALNPPKLVDSDGNSSSDLQTDQVGFFYTGSFESFDMNLFTTYSFTTYSQDHC